MQQFTVLPGRSAYWLLIRGVQLEGLGLLCGVAISFESYFPSPLAWRLPFLGICLVVVAIGVVTSFRAYSRIKVEKAAGYATLWKIARENPDLVYVDSKDGQVIAAAGEPRPPSGRRADIEAAKARYQS